MDKSTYSLTQTGNLTVFAGALVVLLSKLGLHVTLEETEIILGAIIALVGGLVSWIGRWRKGDITFAGFRKS